MTASSCSASVTGKSLYGGIAGRPILRCQPQVLRLRDGFRANGDRAEQAPRSPSLRHSGRAVLLSGETLRGLYSGFTFAAAGPFCPCVTSKETFWPSFSDLNPAAWIEL